MKCALSFFLHPSEDHTLNSLEQLPRPFSIFKSSYHFYHGKKQTNKQIKKSNKEKNKQYFT